jgi:hypothetical protein
LLSIVLTASGSSFTPSIKNRRSRTGHQEPAIMHRHTSIDLHWPALDVDLFVPGLVVGIFGTRAWMTRELARVAGQTTSPAKAAAARSNGAKGGRPRNAKAFVS